MSSIPTNSPPPSPITPPFVGRRRDLDVLRLRLLAALGGNGSVVLIGGEPGIGKTRIAEEIAREAATDDVLVVWAFCDRWEGSPAFWPWTQIVRALARAGFDTDLPEQVVERFAVLLPDTNARQARDSHMPERGSDLMQFQLFESVAEYLRRASEQQPLVLILDDMHWADASSVLLLAFLSTEIAERRILILVTYRDSDVHRRHPLFPVIADVPRRHSTHRLILPRLTPEDVSHYIALSVDHEPDKEVVDAVIARTEGNPLFVKEVVRLWMAEGHQDWEVQGLPLSSRLPETIREVVLRHIDRLPPEPQQMLSAAAVIGRDFSLHILRTVVDLPVAQVLASLDAALQSQIIEETVEPNRYRFRHVLIQEALYQEIPTVERILLHKASGEAIEQTYFGNLAPHVTALAHHFSQVARLGDACKGMTYLSEAGSQAIARGAWDSAVDFFQRALTLLDLAHPLDEIRRCELLLGLADAQWSGAEPESARSTYARVLEIARTVERADHFARAAIGYAGNDTVGTAVRDPRSVWLLEEALAYSNAVSDALRVRLLCQLTYALFNDDDVLDRRRYLTGDALEIVRRLDNPSLLLHVLDARWYALAGPDTLAERVVIATEEVALARATGDAHAELLANGGLAADSLETGDMEAFDQYAGQYARLAMELRLPVHQFGAHLFTISRATMRGRLAEAEEVIDHAWPLGRRALPGTAADRIMTQFLFEIRREQERLDDVEARLLRFTGENIGSESVYWQARLALLQCERGQIDLARSTFNRLAGQQFSDIPRDGYWLVNMALLGELASLCDDRECAASLYRMLSPYPDRNVNTNLFWASHGSVSHYLGVLAIALGYPDEAATHFTNALEMHERMGADLFLVRSQHAYARLLFCRDLSGDCDEGVALVQRALERANRLGFVRSQRLLRSLVGDLARALPRQRDTPMHRLTEREREVLHLIAEGKSDREIAEQLFISPRTVMRHVSNIFNKLGVSSRAAAVSVAIRHNLL